MKNLFLGFIALCLISTANAETAKELMLKNKEKMQKPKFAVELQGEISPWMGKRSGFTAGLRYSTGMVKFDTRIRSVKGQYRALFADLNDAELATNTSESFNQRKISSGDLSGIFFEPGILVRGKLWRSEESRWEQYARVGYTFGTLNDDLYADKISVRALTAEFGMPYRINKNETFYFTPYLGYETGSAHTEKPAGDMSHRRKLYYLSYRMGVGLEFLF